MINCDKSVILTVNPGNYFEYMYHVYSGSVVFLESGVIGRKVSRAIVKVVYRIKAPQKVWNKITSQQKG